MGADGLGVGVNQQQAVQVLIIFKRILWSLDCVLFN